MLSRRSVLVVASAGALLLVSAPAAAAAHSYTVVIDKMKFGPLPTELKKGDTIVWVNRDFLRHSATAADHRFDVDLMPGKAQRMVLTRAGTIPFTCRYHPGMKGVLQVK